MIEQHFKFSRSMIAQLWEGQVVSIISKDIVYKFTVEETAPHEWSEVIRGEEEPPYPFCDSCDEMSTHQCMVNTSKEFCDRWLCDKHKHNHQGG